MAHSDDANLAQFDTWAVSIGDGTAPPAGALEEELIRLPSELCYQVQEGRIQEGMREFCELVYPDLAQRFGELDFMQGRAILAPTNQSVDLINNYLMSLLPTEEFVLVSADTTVQPGDASVYPTELLNTLEPQGLPVHRLKLRPGAVLRLMRNLNPKDGLCNGTRMTFIKVVDKKLLHCTIKDKTHQKGERDVFIPRIQLPPKNIEQFGFEWVRRQFPVRAAFAQTVNASQGQTMKKVGVWLVDHSCFTHGQLYVAASRVGHPEDLHFAIMKPAKPEEAYLTKNIVYREVLLHGGSLEGATIASSSSVINMVDLGDCDEESADIGGVGIYDGLSDDEEEVEGGDDSLSTRTVFLPRRRTTPSLSIALPAYTEAALPTSQETEVSWSAMLN